MALAQRGQQHHPTPKENEMPKRSKKAEQEHLLHLAIEAQHHFWDVARQLEEALGFDLDDLSQDLSTVSIADLRKQANS